MYLANESARVVSDADSALKKLVASEISDKAEVGSAGSLQGGCFTPPPRGLTYYAQKSVFAVADKGRRGYKVKKGKYGKRVGKKQILRIGAGKSAKKSS